MSELRAHLAALARNNCWSNFRLHAACGKLSEEEYFRSRTSFFGSIHATLEHIFLVDCAYFDRLTGEDHAQENLKRGALTEEQRAIDKRLIAFCDGLEAAKLERAVQFVNSEGVHNADPVYRVLSHLFVHQIHHRGQVHGLLSMTSVAPPQLDEFFLSGDLPRREHEIVELGYASDSSS